MRKYVRKKDTPSPARNARVRKRELLAIGGEMSAYLYPVLSTRAVGNALGISQMAVSYIERLALAKVYLNMKRP